MAIGDRGVCRRTVFHDERTGRTVWRMTDWDDCHCVATYMYLQAFSGDERFIVFSANRTGRYELYRLEIASGETAQLTDYTGSELSDAYLGFPHVHPAGREVFFDDGRSLWAIDFASLDRREVARRPDHWQADYNGPRFSMDGRLVYCSFRDAEGRVNLARAACAGSALEDIYRWPHPDADVDHLLTAPVAEEILTFSPLPDGQNDPDNPREKRARSWKLDVASGKAEPFVVAPPGHRATHEFWGPPGNPRLYFHMKTVPSWIPDSVSSISLQGDDMRHHLCSPTRKLGHSCLDRAMTRLVSDVQDPEGNELIMLDLKTGAEEILCWPDSSVRSGDVQIGHVHPSFSPSGDMLIYTSDKGGMAAVYIVPFAGEIRA